MKSLLTFSFLCLIFASCTGGDGKNKSSSNAADTDTLALLNGTWTLTKELHSKGKNVIWEGRPTVPQLTFDKNSYFILADLVTDKKMQQEGIPAIQDRYKGQYTWKDQVLKLDHYEGDSLIVESFEIKKINGEQLVINDDQRSRTWFFKR